MCWQCDNPNGTTEDSLNELLVMVDDGTILAPAMHIDYQDRFLVEVDCPDVHLKYAGIGSRCSEFAPLCRDAAARVKRRNGRRRLTLQTPIWSHL
jgi:hypothetical protein